MSDGLNPPQPVSAAVNDGEDDASSSTSKSQAQQFLNLVRLVEKETDESTYDSYMEELVRLINSLIDLYFRRGLLQGNIEKADRILASTSTTNQSKKSGAHDKKGAGRKATGSEFHAGEGSTASTDSSIPETLVFTALTRILNDSKEASLSPAPPSIDKASDSALLTSLAAELCLAVSQYVQYHRGSKDSCSTAEYELLANSGKPLLNGIVAKVNALEVDLRNSAGKINGVSPQKMEKCLATSKIANRDMHLTPVLSCLRAACSLVNLFGTKLSRSTAVLADLKGIAWKFLSSSEELLQRSAARLLAAMPLAGGTNQRGPSELWNEGVADILSMMNHLMETVAPVAKSSIRETTISNEADAVLHRWLSFIRQDISKDQIRVKTLRSLLRGLAMAFQHFMLRDIYCHSSSVLVEARIDLESILDVVERFLSYSMSAESLFFRTKKRLRDEIVDGGIISIRVIATELANSVKVLGHDMIDCLISSVGGPALLPCAKRIVRMSYASLLTSCSGPVRKVMDHASAMQLEGKKRRWLHLSIPVRTRAVKTTHLVLAAFGSDRTAKLESSERAADSKSDGEMALTLVAACSMEQMGSTSASEDKDETWGTVEERVGLMNACLDCLRGALASFNGFMGFNTRSIIDSMVLTCLDKEVGARRDLIGWSSVQCAMFRLASTCVTTPWNDGSVTSIVSDVKRVALKATLEQDESVSSVANDVLRLCDMFGNPRAPPIIIVTRNHDTAKAEETSAPNLIEKIQTAHVEAAKARATMEDAEKSKVKDKRRREAEKEESKKRKREAKEKSAIDRGTKAEIVPEVEQEPLHLQDRDVAPETEKQPFDMQDQNGKVTETAVDAADAVDRSITQADVPSMEVNVKPHETVVEEREAKNKESIIVSATAEVGKPREEPEDDDDDEMDEDFPDIVAGGPDSDDD